MDKNERKVVNVVEKDEDTIEYPGADKRPTVSG